MRKKWEQLTKQQQAIYTEVVDLEEGETMADWWEAWMDSIQYDGSYKTEGWPGGEE